MGRAGQELRRRGTHRAGRDRRRPLGRPRLQQRAVAAQLHERRPLLRERCSDPHGKLPCRRIGHNVADAGGHAELLAQPGGHPKELSLATLVEPKCTSHFAG